ncbi:hypothetical protein B0H10DRAFT_1947434 [Mycena sp. CBHHK59/15]|nr:hypothetical protein B0H10DRAFT_1947434 [Mycena sp. CBHHK59/15]
MGATEKAEGSGDGGGSLEKVETLVERWSDISRERRFPFQNMLATQLLAPLADASSSLTTVSSAHLGKSLIDSGERVARRRAQFGTDPAENWGTSGSTWVYMGLRFVAVALFQRSSFRWISGGGLVGSVQALAARSQIGILLINNSRRPRKQFKEIFRGMANGLRPFASKNQSGRRSGFRRYPAIAAPSTRTRALVSISSNVKLRAGSCNQADIPDIRFVHAGVAILYDRETGSVSTKSAIRRSYLVEELIDEEHDGFYKFINNGSAVPLLLPTADKSVAAVAEFYHSRSMFNFTRPKTAFNLN